ncbi:DNA-binding response regulator [Sphingomonas paeninsulae]|jgi:DNA-binding response OmpR family regulator|uniref:DNA-binding response regulator n=1 Tax=Sphingomonas paeninsulae TaxID=2319844 RepID=A0A494TKB1_SPHPE|nr:response regulator transcription factor [Sphingomonas paeninsulae]AYJ85858.1 DNA-binding response regulator [Sphingomonas paeninsulae]
MRLLIVEDDAELADALMAAFERHDIHCDHAKSAGDTLQMVATTSYSLIVLDLGLPDESGLSVIKRMRSRGQVEPVIILTARSDAPTRLEGLRSGADDFIVKPFLFDELHARVEAVLRRQGGYVDRRIGIGDLSLDTETRELTICGEQISMSIRETELLEILLRRSEHVTPKRVLEDQLFGSGDTLGSNAVEVYVHRIRQKLKSRSLDVELQTVRGIGYILKRLR